MTIKDYVAQDQMPFLSPSVKTRDVSIRSSRNELCPNSPDIVLQSSFSYGNVWTKDNIVVGTSDILQVNEPGEYILSNNTPTCGAVMASTIVTEGTNCFEEKSWQCDPDISMLYEEEEEGLTCEELIAQMAEFNAVNEYRNYLDGLREDFRLNYIQSCMNVQETFTLDYDREAEFHYTLYYYDQAGNLVRTVPPEGVTPLTPAQIDQIETDVENNNRTFYTEHTYDSKYAFNSLNQLIGFFGAR